MQNHSAGSAMFPLKFLNFLASDVAESHWLPGFVDAALFTMAVLLTCLHPLLSAGLYVQLFLSAGQ